MSVKKVKTTETAETLNAKLLEFKKKNEQDAVKEIEAVCKKYNVIIVPNIQLHIQGKEVGVMVKSL